jgi:subtilase family serine protease
MRSFRKVLTFGSGAVVMLGGGLVSMAAAPALAQAVATTAHAAPMVYSIPFSSTPPPTETKCLATDHIPCYQPAQIQTAYDERPLFARHVTGAGETIVIVDPFGAPTIATTLATFDTAFGLPAPPSFKVIQPDGPVPAFKPTTGTMISGDVESSLDVEWSHVMAPGANILLVESPVAETEGTVGFPQIVQAENYVIDHHLGDVISQSFGRDVPFAANDPEPPQRLHQRLPARRDRARIDRGYRRDQLRHSDRQELLYIPGRQLAGERPARDGSRRNQAQP